MKKIFLIVYILFSFSVLAQKESYIKIDTLFFSGKIPKISESKMNKILKGVRNECDPNQQEVFNKAIESNLEFRTISTLKLFNKEAKTSIFTNSDVVLVAYFCQNIDYVDKIEFYEFIFENDQLAKTLIDKLIFLYNKKGFNDYIGVKNWYYKRIENRVYFIDYKQENPNNIIKNYLKLNIDSISH